MGEEEIKEASTAAQMVVGWSAYLHSVGYSVEKFREELDATVEYIKSQA